MWRLGVDVGGTFTDLALVHEGTGDLHVWKTPTVPADPAAGVLRGVAELLAAAGVEPSQVTYCGLGSTLALNTLLQRSGARTGLLVTRGFRDVLEMRRTRLPDAPSFEARRPRALVPRSLVREVRERVLADGRVREPLDLESVDRAAAELVEQGVEALAICFLHAYANPDHERRAKAWVRGRWPRLWVVTSSELWPQQREYERALVTCMNASLGPPLQAYSARLREGLRHLGLRCPLLVTQSNGGVVSLEDATRYPVWTVFSGPAAGVSAAWKLAGPLGVERLFTLDVGGTSADLAVVDGRPVVTTEATVGSDPLFLPAVGVHSIGAGGGSVAWVDAQGVLKVGPRSAGSDPGPACYGRGGTEPTLTDAYLVLGLLGEEGLAGGTVPLHRRLAEEAVGRLAARLGFGLVETAEAVVRVATANMVAEFLPLVARHGVDARDFALVCFGGAGPTHGFLFAREAGLRRVLVPPAPGALCAVGASLADLQRDFVRSLRHTLVPGDGLRALYGDLEREAVEWLAAEGLPADSARFEYGADLRYRGQSYELTVWFDPAEDPAGAFARHYERVYGYHDPSGAVEVLQLRLRVGLPGPAVSPRAVAREPARTARARTVFADGRAVSVPVFRRQDLLPGRVMEGPSVVAQYDTTVFVPRGFRFWQDARGVLWGEAAA